MVLKVHISMMKINLELKGYSAIVPSMAGYNLYLILVDEKDNEDIS